MNERIARLRPGTVRAATLRRSAFNLLKACSIGLRSGEYFGRAESIQLFKKGCHAVEYRFFKKDGTYCWVNDAQQLVRDEKGQPAEVVGSWGDVTERKRAEEAAAAARERVEYLLSSSPAVIYSFLATGD